MYRLVFASVVSGWAESLSGHQCRSVFASMWLLSCMMPSGKDQLGNSHPTSPSATWVPKLLIDKKAAKNKTWRQKFHEKLENFRGINPTSELENLKKEMEMDEHMLTIAEVCQRYQTSPNLGLLQAQAEGRLKRYGPNKMEPPPLETEWKKFFRKVFRRFSILLWASSMLCFVSYGVEFISFSQATPDNLYLGIVLIIAVVVSGSFQYFQERRTQSLLDSFKKLIPSVAHVWRDGHLKSVPSENLVIGDIVELRPGDKVPADLRIIASSALKVDNSTLTGESELQTLDIHCTNFNPWETANLAFFPKVIMEGRGKGVVIRTGDDMVMGRIANLTESLERPETPISKEIVNFIHVVTLVSGVLGILLFLVAIICKNDWLDAVMLLIGLLVANAPEGILVTVMASLNLAAKKMAKKNCVVKHLEAVETLGSVSTICADKTGTLTCNRMTVSHLWYNGQTVGVDMDTDSGLDSLVDMTDPVVSAMIRVTALCNNASFSLGGQDKMPIKTRPITGGPTDAGLLRFAETVLGDVERVRNRNKKVYEVPFNSTNKFKLSIHQNEDTDESYMIILMKGAPENIIGVCTTVFFNGEEIELNDEIRQSYTDACITLAADGGRVVGLCDYRLPHADYPPTYEFDERYVYPKSGYRLLGIIGMVDPLRPGVPTAVTRCRQAGIKVIMITGDHLTTAKSVAKSANIITVEEDSILTFDELSASPSPEILATRAPAMVIHGKQLQNLKSSQLDNIIRSSEELVFARTTPQQKLIIVESCQRTGSIVAVTGDGVNDSPALKQGDIGIAMGITGNDICKHAADIVLLDDNFVSIVFGVEEGRLIFENLKKAIAYTLTSNIPELVPFLALVVLHIPLPLGTVCVLCIDLGTDCWPAISFAYETAERDLMAMPCRNPANDRLVNRRTLSFTYGMVGMIQAMAGFFAYFVVYAQHGFRPRKLFGLREQWEAKDTEVEDSYGQQWSYGQRKQLEYAGYAAYFAAIVLVQWADVVISKNRFKSIVTRPMNWPLNGALVFETVLATIMCYCPGVNSTLYFEPLKFTWWFLAFPFAILIFVLDELRRFIMRKQPGGFIERETYY